MNLFPRGSFMHSLSFLFPGATLCVGSEWHRFPSSFFVPDYIKEVRWIDDGFRGLLPFPFNSTLGGTAAAPHYFNDKNKASDEQYVIRSSDLSCFYFLLYGPICTKLHTLLQLLLICYFSFATSKIVHCL